MEQTKALNALEPFLALTKSASSPRAAVDLITRSTSAQNTYIFTPLLLSPQIQALSQNSEYASHLKLLEIFCYGTYSSYQSEPQSSLPPLNPAQTHKLRQLSLLTLARDPTNLTYANLISVLALSDARELEDLVISAIYNCLISGTLDPQQKVVCISSIAPLRDVAPQSISGMIRTLQEWEGRCTDTLADLEKQIADIKSEARRRVGEERRWDEEVTAMLAAAGKENFDEGQGRKGGRRLGEGQKRGFMGGSGEVDDGDMDLDDEEEDSGGTAQRYVKKRGFPFQH